MALFSGCSARSKGFFEDIYSATEERSATQADYSAIKAAKNAPIITDTQRDEEVKLRKERQKAYSSNSSEIYKATGKIIDVDYDKDVNLYIYAFLKTGTANPISFYYDEKIEQIGNIVTVTIKDNFLTSISENHSILDKNSKKVQRTKTKRRRSRIKVPIVERINTL
jgi:hypothetical protein